MRKLYYMLALAGTAMIFVHCTPRNIQDEAQPTLVSPLTDSLAPTTVLPDQVDESSGLAYFNGQLWTHNDSGDDPVLYNISTSTSDLLQTVDIENAGAYDWEELTQDENFIYIGDFGNNDGDRQDLCIYKVSKEAILNDSIENVATKISFHFEDQTDFEHDAYDHNFDCEAMINYGDSLYLFSKNHQNGKCRFYSLPKTPGNHSAQLKGEMDTDGLITAADMDTENNTLALLGYSVYKEDGKWHNQPFVWLMHEFDSTAFFSGQAIKVNIAEEHQTEGICYKENGIFIISSEGEGSDTGYLFSFDSKKWID